MHRHGRIDQHVGVRNEIDRCHKATRRSLVRSFALDRGAAKCALINAVTSAITVSASARTGRCALATSVTPLRGRTGRMDTIKIDLGIAVLNGGKAVGDHPLGQAQGMYGALFDFLAALEMRGQPLEHRLHDPRHAGHDVNVFHLETGRHRHGVIDQFRTPRHGRHALPRGVEVTRFIGVLHATPGNRMRLPGDTERGGDAFTPW